MQNAVAFSDNDVVTIAWSYGKKPSGCMGFALYRIDDKGQETALPSFAVFKGFQRGPNSTTADFPIQKFYWKDPYARLIAEKPGNGNTFRYKVVPLEGQPGHLTPMKNLPTIISNEVMISPVVSAGVSAFFNRGLISTQRVSRAMAGHPNVGSLLKSIADEQDPLRASLTGDMLGALTGFLDRAKNAGKIYAALYELGDPQLIQRLEALGNRLEIVLSNSVVTDSTTKSKSDGNQTARDGLTHSTQTLWNRIMPSGHIGHNKFLVYVDGGGQPQAVLFGSTNWTSTGLCTQTNNTLVVEDSNLAQRYLDYWNKLAKDTQDAAGAAKDLQAGPLRAWDAKDKQLKLPSAALDSWFSPNTPKPRGRNKANEKRPPDMAALVDRINHAQHAILFLAFQPGTPSIANWAADALKKNAQLFVRGCVTSSSASEGFYYELKGTTPPKKQKGVKTPVRQDPRVIAAEALDSTDVPEGWQKELLSAGHAIIHDKIVVIDPFSDDCVVVTGSHNLGHEASYNNDENLAIIQGDKRLAAAYATHVLDVYDHFAWRVMVKRLGPDGADQSLKATADEWLGQYYDTHGEVKSAQLKFWMEAAT